MSRETGPERRSESPPRDWLLEYLAEHDASCPCCGYNLRGLAAGRCPECNEALVLAVRPAEPRLAWFVCGLVGLASGAGFHGIVLLWLLWVWVMRARGPSPAEVIPVIVLAPVSAGLTAAWVWGRRAVGRMSPGARWGWVAAGWASTMLGALLFFSTVR